jgi:hypothetical protein
MVRAGYQRSIELGPASLSDDAEADRQAHMNLSPHQALKRYHVLSRPSVAGLSQQEEDAVGVDVDVRRASSQHADYARSLMPAAFQWSVPSQEAEESMPCHANANLQLPGTVEYPALLSDRTHIYFIQSLGAWAKRGAASYKHFHFLACHNR